LPEQDVNDLIALIEVGEGSKQTLDDVIRAHSEISRENVRWKVTSVVIWVYAVVILSTIFYLIISSFVYSEDMFGNIIEVIKIALIPVVTFIVGYYYGTSSKS
jgi:hypothetical protein